METNNNITRTIHYVMQGRSIENNKNYIEQKFVEINPLEARIKAFSHLEYYVQLLHQGKKIFFRENEKIVNEEILLGNINKYEISFAENNLGQDGIAVYMVVNRQTKILNTILNLKEERHLIYSVQNLTEYKIENIKHALIKEFRYYNQLNICTSNNQDEVSLYEDPDSESMSDNAVVYKILKTPINFCVFALKTFQSHLFREQVERDFKVIDLQKTTFISELDWHTINIHIASFFNTDGGKIYLGKLVKNQMINCIDTTSISICNQLLRKNILKNFPKHKHLLLFKFVKINKVLVPVIEVKFSQGMLNFYNNNEINNFYFRSKKGLEIINETEKIAEYVLKNGEYNLSDLTDILDKL